MLEQIQIYFMSADSIDYCFSIISNGSLIEQVLNHPLWIPPLSSQKNVSRKGKILRKADLILKGKEFCFVCHILFNPF